MVLAAPELVVAERVELLDEVEIAAELQHRILADRMMRGEKGAEFQACHGWFSPKNIVLLELLAAKVRGGAGHGNAANPAASAWLSRGSDCLTVGRN